MKTKRDNSEYGKQLQKLLGDISKQHGVVIGEIPPVESFTSGILSLDMATGIGGYPKGRITVVAGWESSGKTTHCLKSAALMQKAGGTVAFIDAEWTFDPVWAESLGVSVEDLILVRADSLEDAAEASVELAESGLVDMIILDSIAGAPIEAVVEGDLGDANMGIRARIMSQYMPKITGPAARNDVVVLIINQLRESLNMFSPRPVMPGGKALGFHSSLTVHLSRKAPTSSMPEQPTTAFIAKNKVSVPFKTVTYLIDETGNVDEIDELVSIILERTEELGIEKGGSWLTLPKEISGEEGMRVQGKPKLLALFREDLDLFEKAKEHVLDIVLNRKKDVQE